MVQPTRTNRSVHPHTGPLGIGAACALGLMAVSGASASETIWISGTEWSVPANWSAGIPTTESTAVFALSQPLVNIALGTEPILIDRLRVERGPVRFNGSSSMTIADINAFTASLLLGTASLEQARLVWGSSGLLQASRLDLAMNSSGTALLEVVSGSLEVTGAARIGVVGDGTLLVVNRPCSFGSVEVGVTAAAAGILAGSAQGTAPIAGLFVDAQATIGKFGEGTAAFGEGSSLGALMVAQESGSRGDVTLSGATSVRGPVTVGLGGVADLTVAGTLDMQGSLSISVEGGSLTPPYVLPSEGTVIVEGRVHCSGEVWGGAGVPVLELRGGSIESGAKITKIYSAGEQSALRVILPEVPSSGPRIAAPTVAWPGWTVEVTGNPAPDAVWHLQRAWVGDTLPATITGNPGAGREWRTIVCGGDLYLATAPIGAPDPAVCPTAEAPIFIADPDQDPARLFGTGGSAASSDWFAVGCPGGTGSVDVFAAGTSSWNRQARLVGPDGLIIGAAVAVDGERLATLTTDGQAVVVFVRNGGAWSVEATFPISSGAISGSISGAVSIAGEWLAVGAPFAVTTGGAARGQLHFFRRTGTAWAWTQTVTQGSAASASSRFGQRVSMSDGRVAVSGESSNNEAGDIEIYAYNGKAWVYDSDVAGIKTSPFQLRGNVLACTTSGTSTLGLWREVDGIWTEWLTGPAAGTTGTGATRPAIEADRFVLAQGGHVRSMLATTTGGWTMGPSVSVSGPVLDLDAEGSLTVATHADGATIVHADVEWTCPADFDNNGVIDGSDLGVILVDWDAVGDHLRGDLTADGTVNAADLRILLAAWGACAG